MRVGADAHLSSLRKGGTELANICALEISGDGSTTIFPGGGPGTVTWVGIEITAQGPGVHNPDIADRMLHAGWWALSYIDTVDYMGVVKVYDTPHFIEFIRQAWYSTNLWDNVPFDTITWHLSYGTTAKLWAACI